MTEQLTNTATANMEQANAPISVHKIAKAFRKFHQGLDQHQLSVLEEELLKMYPTEESEVVIYTDYDEEDNSIGVGLYLSKGIQVEASQKIGFDELMSRYLSRMDIERMPQLYSCINLMERKEGDIYEVDFIPVFYDDGIKEHTINFRITKK